MNRVLIEPDFNYWRTHARNLLQQGFLPEELDLQDQTSNETLPLPLQPIEEIPTGRPVLAPHVSKAFLALAEVVAVHRDPQRWNLLYRVLFRLQGDQSLLNVLIDDDISRLRQLEQQVRRDLHKMHAFVRFRKVEVDAIDQANPFLLQANSLLSQDGTVLSAPVVDSASAAKGTEHFVAWYQPDHRILPLAAPFFAERFAVMDWSILTPDSSVSWDPRRKVLQFGPGLPREAAPSEDDLEDLWRTYYASIFNPARLNPGVMRQEMPIRYWKDLPEVSLLPSLITHAKDRVGAMVQTQAGKPSAAPFVPPEHTLPVINAALPSCQGCDLYQFATQVVPGTGPSVEGPHTLPTLMLVGEQPGDQEDQKGIPFVGPAGRILDQALAELKISRTAIYLTNAVKHFKFVQRGKIRLHQNPRTSEITACRPWLLAEIDAVRPTVILCLGASASKSLLGGTFALMRDHGKVLSSPYAEQVIATIHPSAVLRARDQQSNEQLYGFLRDDLALAWQTALGSGIHS